MQAVNILCNQGVDFSVGLELRQRAMRCIGSGLREALPANKTSCPVALPETGTTHKLLVLDRGLYLRLSVTIAVIGDSRSGADPGATQHSQRS